MNDILKGILFWAAVGGALFLIRPGSSLHRTFASDMSHKQTIAFALLTAALIAVSAFLMTLSPIWNGMDAGGHRDGYERMTEAMLQGRIDFLEDPDPALVALENPYDPDQRWAANAPARWDWSYYKGRYYLYFGVVPIFLAFMPYRILVGHALTACHASQLFCALYIIGLAVYFLWLAKKKFRKMTVGQLFVLMSALSLISVLYTMKFPAFYQTPVICGIFLEIWSLLFFSKAVFEERDERSAIRWAFFGSLCGALSFGCRPTLALANLLVLPMLVHFLKGRKITPRLAGRLVLAALPYALTAAALMTYNYLRFENPFEFGQAYQITLVDQTKWGNVLDPLNLIRVPVRVFNSFAAMPVVEENFPFLTLGMGAFACCPLLLYALSDIRKRYRMVLKEKQLDSFAATILVAVLLIVAAQAVWTPFMWDRYKSDYMWLLSLGAFIGIGAYTEAGQDARAASRRTCFAAFLCVLIAALVFLIPEDASWTDYFPEMVQRTWNVLTFGLFG